MEINFGWLFIYGVIIFVLLFSWLIYSIKSDIREKYILNGERYSKLESFKSIERDGF